MSKRVSCLAYVCFAFVSVLWRGDFVGRAEYEF